MSPIGGARFGLRSSPAEAVIDAGYELILGIGVVGRATIGQTAGL